MSDKKINTSDLAEIVACRLGIRTETVKDVLATIVVVVNEYLAKDLIIVFRGLGSFQMKKVKPTRRHDISKGKVVEFGECSYKSFTFHQKKKSTTP